MKKKSTGFLGLPLILLMGIGFLFSSQNKTPEKGLVSPKELWQCFQKNLPPFKYSVRKDEIIPSFTDPDQKLRRVEVIFISQIVDDAKMGHAGVIFMPLEIPKDRRGKVVITAHAFDDDTFELNYAEPIAARTGYPVMSLLLPGDYDGEDGEIKWLRMFRQRARDTQDPIHHDFFRSAVPYLQAVDVFADLLKMKDIQAIIGGHSKRAYYAYTAAGMDPDRIAGVIFMGCERLYSKDEKSPDPSELAHFSDTEAYPPSLIPFQTQKFVKCPILYLGATNEGGYTMFNINKIQEKMEGKWVIKYIPNYGHASGNEKQFMDWRMWVAHIFDGRPLTRIHDLRFEETEDGTRFEVRIDSPNKIIQVKAWYVYNDDIPYWRDLMWYPVTMKCRQGNLYEGYVGGALPDAWLVEVKDTALGFPGYVSSLPKNLTGKPAEERNGSRPRNWELKKKNEGGVN
jgi:hypothetical protein